VLAGCYVYFVRAWFCFLQFFGEELHLAHGDLQHPVWYMCARACVQSNRNLHLLSEMRKINVTVLYLCSRSLMPRSPEWSCRPYPTMWDDFS